MGQWTLKRKNKYVTLSYIFSDSMKRREEGYIGEELLSNDTEIERTCLVVSQVVKEKAFPLEEALQLYGVSQEAYLKFTVKKLADHINGIDLFIGHFESKTTEVNFRVSILAALEEVLLPVSKFQHDNSKEYYKHLESGILKLVNSH